MTFVGRQDELQVLSLALDRAIAGAGQLVVITGEAGIGKTRLCEELASGADARGAGVAWAACWESGGLPPFWPWRELLGQLDAQFEPTAPGESGPGVARALFFSEVFDVLRRVARVRPRLLVLDDVQWADPGTARLLSYVGPLMRSVSVLLVATARETDSPAAPIEAGVWRHAHSIRLGGLGAPELAELVSQLTGSQPGSNVNEALLRATAGNPLFAAELVRQLHRVGKLELLAGDEPVPVPPTVRAVLDEQLANLDPRSRQLLEIAAVVGQEFSLRLLADVSGRGHPEVLQAMEQAMAGGIVTSASVGRYAFSHPLLRSVVHDDIGIATRVRLHQQVGEAIESRGGDLDLATLSFHYLNAAPGGAAGKAIHYAEKAALSAFAALGYEDAVELYERALAAAELDTGTSDRGTILLGLGMARAACGDPRRAREAFLLAADHARREGRWSLLAGAALALAGAGFEVPLFDDEQITLLEEATVALGDEEPALRSRLCGRLSVALSLAGHEARRTELSTLAVRLAHEAGDPAALAHALAVRCDAHAGPAHTAQRSADAADIVRIARESRDHGTELLGRRLRLVASLNTGDVRAVDAEVLAFSRVAERLRQAQYDWYIPLWRATLAAMRGRLGEQLALTTQAEVLARAAGSVNAHILLLTQRWFTRIEAGDVETALAQIEILLPPGTYDELGPRMLPLSAKQRLLAGRDAEARAMLDAAADDLVAMNHDSEWLTTLAQVGELCCALGGHDLSRWIYDSLAPFADQWVVEGIAAYTHGSVHRYLGLLDALHGHPEAASAHFDAALHAHRSAGADLLASRTLLERGIALGEADALRAALAAYRDLRVEHRVDQVERLLGAPSTLREGPPSVSSSTFTPEGDMWVLAFAGRRTRLRDSKGARDIARLLAQPGREIPALDLATPFGTKVPRGNVGEALDLEARAKYKARLIELEADLDEADSAGDGERSARVQAERDMLLEQLSTAYGLAGRPRRAGDPSERARTAVTARIRDAIRRIETSHPELGRHLARSIRTGTLCSYQPEAPIRWEL